MASTATSTITSTESGFLGLPAEVRNRIYQFALTNGNSLFAEVNWPRGRFLLSASVSAGIETMQEFNQLKYVCRQLQQETAGLELKYNDLEVWKLNDDGRSIVELPSLIAGCVCKSKKHWLNGIVLHLKEQTGISIQAYDRFTGLFKLLAFCKEFPLTTVHVTLQEWSMKLPHRSNSSYGSIGHGALQFFEEGLNWWIVLHGPLPIPALTRWVFPNGPLSSAVDQIIGDGAHRVSNLRVFPSGVRPDKDEWVIHEVGLRLSTWAALGDERPDAIAQQCVALFRDWVKHGICVRMSL